MIGLKLKNSVWEKALLNLLKGQAEIWQNGKIYSAILTDFKKEELKIFKKMSTPLIGLGNNLKYTIPIPCTKEKLESVITQIFPPYENNFFIWDPLHRQLKNKKTQKTIFLTEKEAGLIDFLNLCPKHEASKEDLLKNVWQYTSGTETHTVESTLQTLRQKLGKESDKLITLSHKKYRLF